MHLSLNILATQISHYTPDPSNNSPVNFSDPFEIIVVIILPLVAIGLYIYWKKTKKRNEE